MDLNGKNALITGASRGIGREISIALARYGCKVGLVARTVKGLKETKREIEKEKGGAFVLAADLRKEHDIETVVKEFHDQIGNIDILVNVAGSWHNRSSIYYGPRLEEIQSNEINEVIDIGIRAPFLLTKLVIPDMVKTGHGKIVQISGGFAGPSDAVGWLHYYVTKKALEDFTQGLAEELRDKNVQVNCISPWFVATEATKKFFPEKFDTALPPEEIAKYAVFLVSEESNNITGSVTVLRNSTDY